MEKAPIKKFAVEARRKLIADVTFQLERYGITEKGIVEPQTSTDKELVFDLGNGNTQTIKGERYVNQYRNLVAHVRGFYADGSPKQQLEQFIEEIAFTWFNRLVAIRFMEVNRYLPVRMLSSEIEGQKLPDLVASPFSGDLEFTDAEKQHIFDLQDANKEDDLFRFLFFKQCNDLSRILPRLFENLEGHNSFSELLVALSFNDPNGVVYHLVNDVEEPWFDIHATGQVQIMGWMYQYYNTDMNDLVYDGSMSKSRLEKELVPAATTIYTPDWVVHYMVENSLGRLWAEGHPDFDKSDWKYYLDEAPQEPQVEQQLKDIRAQYAKMEPEQLKVIDPCMGSGHILCYLFDVLMQIYLDNGYSKREAVRSILENNLFGLDISKRAAQIAYFSVMMKAREYDSGFFVRKNIPQPRVFNIQESNWMGGAYKHEMGSFLNSQEHRDTLNYLLDTFIDAKEYGSILQIKPLDYEGLKEAWDTSAAATASNFNMAFWYSAVKDSVEQLIEQAIMLSQKYDAVVTNPPYLGSSRFSKKLDTFVKDNYADVKSDLSMVMLKKALASYVKKNGFVSFITTSSWMFLSSFEKLRDYMFETSTIDTLIDFGTELFDGKVGHNPITAWVNRKTSTAFNMTAIRLVDYCYARRDEKEAEFFNFQNRYFANQDNFAKIPGRPVAYWASDVLISDFSNGNIIADYAKPRQGMSTCDVDRFTKLWHEVGIHDTNVFDKNNIEKWVRYNKGGNFRKWYGNREYIVYWGEDGETLRQNGALLRNRDVYFMPFLAWTKISSAGTGFRKFEDFFLFDGAGGSLFVSGNNISESYLLGLLNSKVSTLVLSLISPTMNFNENHIGAVPVIQSKNSQEDTVIEELVNGAVKKSKSDWDAFETSWDFKRHPLV